jgi:hypothetical protein
MRRIVWLTAAAMLAVPARAWSQQPEQKADQQPTQQQDQSTSQTVQTPALQQDSLAEAARKAREQKKDAAPKPARVFTNDNLPTQGGISSVGASASGSASDSASDSTPAAGAGKTSNDEKAWRDKFASLHHKLDQDQENLDVMQRELGVLNTQFYGDPMKGLQQGLTRSDINQKIDDINKMTAKIEADKQAISDAEDDLRKSGGDPGWAR